MAASGFLQFLVIAIAPQVTYLMHELKEKGLNVDTDATTVAEARACLLEALTGIDSGKTDFHM